MEKYPNSYSSITHKIMKTRSGFVSNSSSSSFIVSLEDLSAQQLRLIQSHQIKGEKLGVQYSMSDPWTIEVLEEDDLGVVKGSTSMNNFDMREFMSRIGVDLNKVSFEED